jgi:type III secretory pathway component EscS
MSFELTALVLFLALTIAWPLLAAMIAGAIIRIVRRREK